MHMSVTLFGLTRIRCSWVYNWMKNMSVHTWIWWNEKYFNHRINGNFLTWVKLTTAVDIEITWKSVITREREILRKGKGRERGEMFARTLVYVCSAVRELCIKVGPDNLRRLYARPLACERAFYLALLIFRSTAFCVYVFKRLTAFLWALLTSPLTGLAFYFQ